MIDLPPRHSPVRYGLAHALLAGLSGLVVLVLRGLASFDVRESIAVHDYLAVAQLGRLVVGALVLLFARTWGVSAGPTPLPVALVHLAALLLLLGSIAWLARESFRLHAPRKR